MKEDIKTEPLVQAFDLVVIAPFGDYQRGDKVTDAYTIEAILSGENVDNVHKVNKGA